MNKEVRKLVQSISQIDGVEVRDGGKHLTVFKDDRFVVTIGRTPSDSRWRDNVVADLRRAGINPKVRPTAMMKTVLLPDASTLRARLLEIDPLSDFARYLVEEVAPVTGLRSYRNPASCASALGQFRKGQTDSLTEWAAVLVDQGLRMRSRVNGQKERAERADTENKFEVFHEAFSNVALVAVEPLPADGAKLALTIDVAKLTEALAGFGISLTVE